MHPIADGGLCGHVPARPECITPHIRFLFIAPPFRIGLPSDPASRRRPCPSPCLRLCKPGHRTFTYEVTRHARRTRPFWVLQLPASKKNWPTGRRPKRSVAALLSYGRILDKPAIGLTVTKSPDPIRICPSAVEKADVQHLSSPACAVFCPNTL